MDDTVLILAEAFQAEREPGGAETVAEVLSAIIETLWKRKSHVRLESMTEMPASFDRKKYGQRRRS